MLDDINKQQDAIQKADEEKKEVKKFAKKQKHDIMLNNLAEDQELRAENAAKLKIEQ